MRTFCILLLSSIFFLSPVIADNKDTKNNNYSFKPVYAREAPVIDGILDDVIWLNAPVIDAHLVSYWPQSGDKLPYKTKIWAAYDENNLYFAFYAYDDEPDKIQSSITRRDNIVPEDWVGVLVNTSGNRQNGYGFYSNPSGIQYDELVTANGEDYTPDWVWYNSAKRTADGYTVEFRIPLKNIVYPSGENVPMCIIFFRKISRLGYVTSWPTVQDGSNSLRAAADAVYENLENNMKLEIMPSLTYGIHWDRQTPDDWEKTSDDFEAGIDVSAGITSSITADITINPDFSQVETDTFQILINQKFPVFFPEKRPFFMELNNQLNLAMNGSSNMGTALHTRLIADPNWGGKIRGELGKFAFSVLAAEDHVSNGEEDNPLFLVGRAKYTLGGDSYIGLMTTHVDRQESTNETIGADIFLNIGADHTVRGNFILTTTEHENGAEDTDGIAWHLNYVYSTRPVTIDLFLEHFDEDFRMDTAFYSETGITHFRGFAGYSFYPEESIDWIERIRPAVYYIVKHNEAADLTEEFLRFNLWFQFPRQGSIVAAYWNFSELWMNQLWEGQYWEFTAGVQAFNWLRLDAFLGIGEQVYYDFANPMIGDEFTWQLSGTLQLSDKLSQYTSYIYQHMKDVTTGEKLYDLDIFTSQTTYQFNKYLFLRASVQYDSSQDIVLTDLLASCTLIPGTVMHLGYGSLHRDQYWDNTEWKTNHNLSEFYQTSQSIFLKLSYRWQK